MEVATSRSLGGSRPLGTTSRRNESSGLRPVRRRRLAVSPTRRLGFSLVELLVVLAIIGITAMVVAPALGSLLGDPAREKNAEVRQLFRESERGALETGESRELRIELRSGRYRLTTERSPAPLAAGTLPDAGTLHTADGSEIGVWRFEGDGRVTGPALFAGGERL